jgi:Flp pilus assembly secretin CpaC
MQTPTVISSSPARSAGKAPSGSRRRRALAWLLIVLVTPGSAVAEESLLERVFRPVIPDSLQSSPSQTDPPPLPQSPHEPPADTLAEKFNQAEEPEEVLPGPGDRFVVPLTDVGTPGEVRYEEHGDLISLVVRDASLSYVLALLAEKRNLNIVAANDVDTSVSITLFNKSVEDALTALLSVANYTWTFHKGIIYVTSISAATSLPPDLQGRRIQVFPLDYTSAQSMQEAVQSFLSPVGQAFITESQPDNNRRTQEVLVVEDLPHSLERIAAFVHAMDQPPRQVLIEAHILQVELSDDRSHGVNFEHLFSIMGNDVSIRTLPGSPLQLPGPQVIAAGSNPAFFASVSGGNLTALIELMKTTNDVKTLASPRLLVVNEQQARLQVGEQLGYRVTTTTETSTLESVNFLDVGVILEITPRITRDNRILLKVRPEVSGGQVNPETGLPDSETSHLETNVLLDDGYGVVIGGLIKETDSVIQSKIPYLGDIYLIGKLFQREEIMKERSEIVVVLIPRVFPYSPDYAAYELGNVVRSETDLFEGPLLRKDRPWQPKLPDALTNPRILRLPPVGKVDFYPAERLEMAATPQPQRAFPIPRRPGPAVPWGGGPMPAPYDGPYAPAAPSPYEPGEPSMPIEFGHDPSPSPVLASPPLSDES